MQTADEIEIRRRIDELIEAVRTMDVEALGHIYGPDIVTFDVAGPLRRIGVEAKRGNWVEAFAMFQPPLGYEIRDVTTTSSGDVAFAHGLARLSGTLKNGKPFGGFWVRFTACLQRVGGRWLIVHDHASVPMDMETRAAAVNLEP